MPHHTRQYAALTAITKIEARTLRPAVKYTRQKPHMLSSSSVIFYKLLSSMIQHEHYYNLPAASDI